MGLVLDTGPLIAAIDADEARHVECARLLERSGTELVVPAPVLVEVDYFLARRGANAFLRVLDNLRAGALTVVDLMPGDYDRVAELMETYADLAVGFVDSAVLAVVERLGEPKLATLDRRRFSVMRPRHVSSLQLLPERA